MDEAKMIEIAEKIKNNTATEEEVLSYTQKIKEIVSEIKADLS